MTYFEYKNIMEKALNKSIDDLRCLKCGKPFNNFKFFNLTCHRGHRYSFNDYVSDFIDMQDGKIRSFTCKEMSGEQIL